MKWPASSLSLPRLTVATRVLERAELNQPALNHSREQTAVRKALVEPEKLADSTEKNPRVPQAEIIFGLVNFFPAVAMGNIRKNSRKSSMADVINVLNVHET